MYTHQDGAVSALELEFRQASLVASLSGYTVIPSKIGAAGVYPTAAFVMALSDPAFLSFAHGLARLVAVNAVQGSPALPSLANVAKSPGTATSLKDPFSDMSSTSKTASTMGSGDAALSSSGGRPVADAPVVGPRGTTTSRLPTRAAVSAAGREKPAPLLKKLDLSSLSRVKTGEVAGRSSHPKSAKADLGGGSAPVFPIPGSGTPRDTGSGPKSPLVPGRTSTAAIAAARKVATTAKAAAALAGDTSRKEQRDLTVATDAASSVKADPFAKKQSHSSSHAKGMVWSCQSIPSLWMLSVLPVPPRRQSEDEAKEGACEACSGRRRALALIRGEAGHLDRGSESKAAR